MSKWNNLFSALRPSSNRPKHLTSILGEGELATCCQVTLSQYEPLLHVPQGQCAALQQGADNARFYPAGEHRLDDITLNQAKLLFVREHGSYRCTWHLDYQDHHQQRLALSGAGALAIERSDHLASSCLADEAFHDDRRFGDWLSEAIAHILHSQRIPCHDIHAENTRFAHFLRDALMLYFRPRGLMLEDLSLDIGVVADDTAAREDDDTTPAVATSPAPSTHMVIAEKSAPEKLFYRVYHGEQQGPLSMTEVQALIDSGALRGSDLLWHKGLSAWRAANTFDGFDWS